MPDDKPRRVLGAIDLRADDSATIPDGNLHRVRHRALRLAADVDGGPGEDEAGGGVDACGGEESADEANAWFGFRVGVAQENAISYRRHEGRSDEEGGAPTSVFAYGSHEDCEDCCEGVRRDCEELGGGGAVAESFDDGG